MNESYLHAGVYGTSLTMAYEERNDVYSGSFFDNVAVDSLRANLFRLCHVIAIGLSAMNHANRTHSILNFHDEFRARLQRYANIVDRYQKEWREFMETDGTR